MTVNEKKELDNVQNIDVTVTNEHLQEDLFKIYNQLFKDIDRDQIIFEELQGGYVNSIYKLSLKKDKTKSLVFRTFGMKYKAEEICSNLNKTNSDAKDVKQEKEQNFSEVKENPELTNEQTIDFEKVLFSRLTEYKVMNEISKHGLCKKVLAKYNNGICYGFTTGVTLNGALMLTNDFLDEMATKLAKFHSINYKIPEIKFETHHERIYEQTDPAFKAILMEIDKKTASINEEPFISFPSAKILFEDDETISNILKDLGYGRIVFCHNDLNQKNIIWDAQNRKLGFIDFEMTMNNYMAVEIGYLFGCFAGHIFYGFNAHFFPNKDYRITFLRKYLHEFNKLNQINLTPKKFDEEVEELYIRTNLTILAFFVRVIMSGPFFDFNPSLLSNEELKKSRETVKYYCTTILLKLYHLYKDLKDPLIEEAKKYLEKKKKVKIESDV